MSRTAKLRRLRRRLGKNWLPYNLFYISKNKKSFSKSKVRRLQLTKKNWLHLYFRSFRITNNQAYLLSIRIPGVYTSSLRQIDIKVVKKNQLRRPKSAQSVNKKFRYSFALIIIGAIGLIFSLSSIKSSSQPVFRPSNVEAPNIATENEPSKSFLSKSKPVSLSINSVDITSPVIGVGKLSDGSMETPNSRNQTGWYKYSPSPGQQGPSVIVGHVDWIDGPAVFWRLREVKAKDKITVRRKDGKTVKFQVYKVAQYDQNNFPTKKVYGNTNGSELRLITCSGTFDASTYSYDKNIVVYAVMV